MRHLYANTPVPDLSILIASLKRREDSLNELLTSLAVQQQQNQSVEIIINTDNGELTTGEKRNQLVQASKGRYLVAVDDDDRVSDTFCSSILSAIKSSPDVVGIEGIITFNGREPQKFVNSLRRCDFDDSYKVKIAPNHINPVRRDIAVNVPFRHITIGEDLDYSAYLYPRLKREEFISGPIYYYNYRFIGKL